MKELSINTLPGVAEKFESYPKHVRPKMQYLRKLILETASSCDGITEMEETLKWGEPSYLVKNGSTLRMDWKERNPNQYAMYFSCQNHLVPTFRILYGDTFSYEKNRAILFGLDDKIPVESLKSCIEMALTYHSIKHLPLLGK